MHNVIKITKKRLIGTVLVILTVATTRTHAQNGEMENLFRDFEAKAANGTPRDVAEAEPALERLAQVSRENIAEVLPVILRETSNPQLSVRRLAASALYQITTRSDGQELLSKETATFATLITDTDIPIRRISMLAIATLRPNASSPFVPVLETYLGRQDAVSTIGAAAPGSSDAACSGRSRVTASRAAT